VVQALNYPADYTKGGKPGEASEAIPRADTLEGLLINHPLDCPVCDKAGECKLQDFSYKYGRSESRMVDDKNRPPNKPGTLQQDHPLYRPLHHVHALRALINPRDLRQRPS